MVEHSNTEPVFANYTDEPEEFIDELLEIINKYSIDDLCNCPDYLLTGFLLGCLKQFRFTHNSHLNQLNSNTND